MKLLLDTHLLLWAADDSKLLPIAARKLIKDPVNELFFSAASIWEIAIKSSRKKKSFQADSRLMRRSLLDNGYSDLPVTSAHAITVDGLPWIHKDPFDRLLIAQAIMEGISLLTVDSLVAKYPGPILKV